MYQNIPTYQKCKDNQRNSKWSTLDQTVAEPSQLIPHQPPITISSPSQRRCHRTSATWRWPLWRGWWRTAGSTDTSDPEAVWIPVYRILQGNGMKMMVAWGSALSPVAALLVVASGSQSFEILMVWQNCHSSLDFPVLPQNRPHFRPLKSLKILPFCEKTRWQRVAMLARSAMQKKRMAVWNLANGSARWHQAWTKQRNTDVKSLWLFNGYSHMFSIVMVLKKKRTEKKNIKNHQIGFQWENLHHRTAASTAVPNRWDAVRWRSSSRIE